MSVEYLYEKKSDDDEYNEIWRALQREQSDFERILLSENKAFVIGRLFEGEYLLRSSGRISISSSTSSRSSWNGKRKPSKRMPRKRRLLGRPNNLSRLWPHLRAPPWHCMKAMAIAEFREARWRKAGVGPGLRERAQSYAAALVLTLLFMGATLPSPLYVIYRDELHFSQITLTLVYAIYFAGAMATLFLGRISDEIGRRVAIFAAVVISIGASLVFILADSLECCLSADC